MEQYLNLLHRILNEGIDKDDRTGTGTRSVFGHQMRFNLADGFPVVTTKRIHFKSVVHELLWFLSGDTNIRYLVRNGVRIWNEWPYRRFQQSSEYQGESLKTFVEKIKTDKVFAERHGDLGPVYGKQWRDFEGRHENVDQLQTIIRQIQENPHSRRHVISSWNPPQIPHMEIPPCHVLFQFYVHEGRLSLQLYQRSADVFLGVPFNIASYSLLLMMVARETGYSPGTFVHSIGDAHIYQNHLEQARIQLGREPRKLPRVYLRERCERVLDFTPEDIVLEGYDPHPHIKAEVSV